MNTERQTSSSSRGTGGLLYGFVLSALLLAAGRSPPRAGSAGESKPPVASGPAYVSPEVASRPVGASWGAIFAGALVSLAGLMTLAAAGLGLALIIYDPLEGPFSLDLSKLGALTAAGLAALVTLFAGGWVSGKLARSPSRLHGALHGLVTWALVSVIFGYVAVSAASRLMERADEMAVELASFAESSLMAAAITAAPAIGAATEVAATAAMENLPIGEIAREVRDLLKQAVRNPEATSKKVERAIAGLESLIAEPSPGAPTDDSTVVALIAQQTGAPPERAVLGVQEWRTDPPENIAAIVETVAQSVESRAAAMLQPIELRVNLLLEQLSDVLALALLLGGAGLFGMAISAAAGGAMGSSSRAVQTNLA